MRFRAQGERLPELWRQRRDCWEREGEQRGAGWAINRLGIPQGELGGETPRGSTRLIRGAEPQRNAAPAPTPPCHAMPCRASDGQKGGNRCQARWPQVAARCQERRVLGSQGGTAGRQGGLDGSRFCCMGGGGANGQALAGVWVGLDLAPDGMRLA